jgi:3-phytase
VVGIEDQNNPYLTSFAIGTTTLLDGSEQTDGLDVVSDSLSPQYPRGLLVVLDGFNYDGDTLRPQNFKLISWADIEAVIPQ